MNHSLKSAFDHVTAGPELRENTLRFLRRKASPRRRSAVRLAAAAAALFLLAGFGAAGVWMYRQPDAYISVDVNPSIELGLNRAGRVVFTRSFNSDGAALLASLRLENKDCETAVTELLQSDGIEKYLAQDAYLLFTVQTDNSVRQQALLSAMQDCADSSIRAQAQYENVLVECAPVDAALRGEAEKHGLSAGKYHEIQELISLDYTKTVEECRHYSMRELRDGIERCHRGESFPARHGGNRHHGGE